MGCCGSGPAEPEMPEVELYPVPTDLALTAAGNDAPFGQPVDTGKRMICYNCKQGMKFLAAHVIKCPSCAGLCLSAPARGELKLNVPVPADPGPGRPFPMQITAAGDERQVLIVPPVEAPVGTVLTVAVARRGQEKTHAEQYHLEARVVHIDTSGAVRQQQGAPQSQAPQTETAQTQKTSVVGSAGGFLKGVASVVAGTAADAVAERIMPKTLILPSSSMQYAGPLGLAGPVGVASMSTAMGASFKCSACGNAVSANAKVCIFRCGCCGTLSTFPVLDKEHLFNFKVQESRFIFRMPAPDNRKVLVDYPVQNIGGKVLTVAVLEKTFNFHAELAATLLKLAGGALLTVCFIMDPVGTLIEGGIEYALEGEDNAPDCIGRVVKIE